MPRRAFGLKLPAASREESPNVRERIATVPPESLLFLDETGAKTNMTRLYGHTRKGMRAVDSAPCGYWHTTTLIGVVGLEGAKAPMVVEGPTDTDLFTAYVEHLLLPELKPGMIVVMDNLTPHKAPAVVAMIKAAGAEPLFSPPYSPDLNPIELMWGRSRNCFVLRRRALNRNYGCCSQSI